MKKKIFFLVDDDSDDVELFCDALAEVDGSVMCYTAETCTDAFNKLNDPQLVKPDIIFMDINMPEMNGWECLAELKNDDRHKDISVIMYSTSSGPREIQRAKDSGALCYFEKPDNFTRLKGMLSVVTKHVNDEKLDGLCEAIHGKPLSS